MESDPARIDRRRSLLVLGGTLLTCVLLAWATTETIGACFDLSPPKIAGWATSIPAARLRHCPADHGFCVTYHTNAQGLREAGWIGLPRPGVPRIVEIGASHTFGWGVEDDQTPPRRLETHLSGALGSRVEVVNMGVPGTGLDSFLRLVHQYARALRPDIIVVDLFEIRNTFYDLDRADWPTLERDYLDAWTRRAETPDADDEAALRGRLLWRSFVYRVVVRTSRRLEGARPGAVWLGPEFTRGLLPADVGDCRASEAPVAALCRDDYPTTLVGLRGHERMLELYELVKREKMIAAACRCAYSPSEVDRRIRGVMTSFDGALLTERRPAALAQIRLSIAALARMQQWAREFGARLYVIVWPNHARLMRVPPAQAARRFWFSSDAVFDSPALTSSILDLCSEYGLTCLDGVTPMRAWAQHRDPETVFFPDRHFTALAGDAFGRVAAELLAPAISVRSASQDGTRGRDG